MKGYKGDKTMKKFMASKWASRKLWTLIGTALFVILTDVLDVPINEETYWSIVGIASSYILGQGFVDGKAVEGTVPADRVAIDEPIQKF